MADETKTTEVQLDALYSTTGFTKTPETASMVVPEIIGLPGATSDPELGGSGENDGFRVDGYERMKRGFPILNVMAMKAEYSGSTELYNMQVASEYISWLAQHDIKLKSGKPELNIACHAMSNPTETYSNSFAPNSLAESMSSVGNEMIADAMFLTGSQSLTGADSLAEQFANSDNSALKGLGEGMQNVANSLGSWANGMSASGGMSGKVGDLAKSIGKTLNKPGARIDFPLMWRSSSYSASYNFTTRLYNPFPESDVCYKNNIVAPLGAMLALALPRSDDGDLYQWPFLCRISIPGLLRIRAAYISSITISKGGDSNDYSLRNPWVRPNLVDVQITFGTLYNVMPMSKEWSDSSDRPTLMDEIKILIDGEKKTIGTAANTPQNPDQSIDREPTMAEKVADAFLNG